MNWQLIHRDLWSLRISNMHNKPLVKRISVLQKKIEDHAEIKLPHTFTSSTKGSNCYDIRQTRDYLAYE